MSTRFALIALLLLVPLAGFACDGGGDDADDAPVAPPATGADRTTATEVAPPAPGAPLPRDPDDLAARLQQTHDSLHAAIASWRAEEDHPARAPREVRLFALHQQRIYVLLGSRERLAREVLDRLDGPVAAAARDTLAARRGLDALTSPVPRASFETGPARPAEVLLGYYREAERRFDVDWQVLAAVNLIESAYGRMRNESTAGARGPMQFIPSTWQAYGMGGDVRDPHDAIIGAANYLQASGAPEDYASALYAYNRSSAYVDAVLGYARAMRRDPHLYYAYHSWQVFVETPAGIRRITGPGVGR